jgi:hypothetical protein
MVEKTAQEWVDERKDKEWVQAVIKVFSEDWLVDTVESKGVSWFNDDKNRRAFIDSMDVTVGLGDLSDGQE